jgi:hypothetical protein
MIDNSLGVAINQPGGSLYLYGSLMSVIEGDGTQRIPIKGLFPSLVHWQRRDSTPPIRRIAIY